MYHRGHGGVPARARNAIVSVAVSKLARMFVGICVLSDANECSLMGFGITHDSSTLQTGLSMEDTNT